MELIRKINTSHNVIFVYTFPAEHSSQAIAEWVIALLAKTDNRNEWINLENTTDSSDDGRDSISLRYDEGVPAIVRELKSRKIDNVLTHINVFDCRISVSITVRGYILSIGLDKKDEDKIQQIETLI